MEKIAVLNATCRVASTQYHEPKDAPPGPRLLKSFLSFAADMCSSIANEVRNVWSGEPNLNSDPISSNSGDQKAKVSYFWECLAIGAGVVVVVAAATLGALYGFDGVALASLCFGVGDILTSGATALHKYYKNK